MLEQAQPTTVRYSAKVRMELHIDGRCLPVAQAGGGQLVFEEPVLLPESAAEFVMRIDDHERRWRVALSPGQTPDRVVAAEFEAL